MADLNKPVSEYPTEPMTRLELLYRYRNRFIDSILALEIDLPVVKARPDNEVFQVEAVMTAQGPMEKKVLNKDYVKQMETSLPRKRTTLEQIEKMIKEEKEASKSTSQGCG